MIANCQHCYTMQHIDGSTICVNTNCMHRADLAAAECDCEQCRPRSVEQCVVTDDDSDDTDLFPVDIGGGS